MIPIIQCVLHLASSTNWTSLGYAILINTSTVLLQISQRIWTRKIQNFKMKVAIIGMFMWNLLLNMVNTSVFFEWSIRLEMLKLSLVSPLMHITRKLNLETVQFRNIPEYVQILILFPPDWNSKLEVFWGFFPQNFLVTWIKRESEDNWAAQSTTAATPNRKETEVKLNELISELMFY